MYYEVTSSVRIPRNEIEDFSVKIILYRNSFLSSICLT